MSLASLPTGLRRLGTRLAICLALGQFLAAQPTPSPTPPQSSQAASVLEIQAQLDQEALDQSWPIQVSEFASQVEVQWRQDVLWLSGRPEREDLRPRELLWEGHQAQWQSWKSQLDQRMQRCDSFLLQLKRESTTPELRQVLEQLNQRQRLLLQLSSSLTQAQARIEQTLEMIGLQRGQILGLALSQDSPPLWSSQVLQQAQSQQFFAQAVESCRQQGEALRRYWEQRPGPSLALLVIFLSLSLMLSRSRRRSALTFVEHPLATALLLTVLLGRRLDPTAPLLFQAGLALLALWPAVVLLRPLIQPQFAPLLQGLLLLSLLDQVRGLAAPVPLLARLLLLLESVLALGFVLGLLARGQLGPRRNGWLLLLGSNFLAVLLAGLSGFTVLAALLANGILDSAYLAVVFYAATQVAEALWQVASASRPLASLAVVRHHGRYLGAQFLGGLRLALAWGWLAAVLEFFSLGPWSLAWLHWFLGSEFGVGSLRLTLGRLLGGGLIWWLARRLSRALRFLAQEDLYPRLGLGAGEIYALSRGIHYSVLMVGGVLALAALGLDTTKFAVVAGALSVGIGFGLQNIVNNFVSGLILLLERPINVGDWIRVGDFQGRLSMIGLRSSLLVIGDGSEVTIPNSDLVNQRVVNWTRRDRARRLSLQIQGQGPLGVALELVPELAAGCTGVAALPTLEVYLLGCSSENSTIQLDCWVEDHDALGQVRSQLILRLRPALEEAGFKITSMA